MNKRILLADDHELVRKGLRTTIKGHYTVCEEASNGREAVEKTIASKPDLVILDITMPILSGFDAAREIRAAVPSAKILMLSMHDAQRVENEAKAVGADTYLSKTAPAGQLMDVIDQLIGVSKSDRQPTSSTPE